MACITTARTALSFVDDDGGEGLVMFSLDIRRSFNIDSSSKSMDLFRAFRFRGRFKVIAKTPFSLRWSISSLPVSLDGDDDAKDRIFLPVVVEFVSTTSKTTPRDLIPRRLRQIIT